MNDTIAQAFLAELDKVGMGWFRKKKPATTTSTVEVHKGVPLTLPPKTVSTINKTHKQVKRDYDAKNLRLKSKMNKMDELMARMRRLRVGSAK